MRFMFQLLNVNFQISNEISKCRCFQQYEHTTKYFHLHWRFVLLSFQMKTLTLLHVFTCYQHSNDRNRGRVGDSIFDQRLLWANSWIQEKTVAVAAYLWKRVRNSWIKSSPVPKLPNAFPVTKLFFVIAIWKRVICCVVKLLTWLEKAPKCRSIQRKWVLSSIVSRLIYVREASYIYARKAILFNAHP